VGFEVVFGEATGDGVEGVEDDGDFGKR
jgi:hypothetical protein